MLDNNENEELVNPAVTTIQETDGFLKLII